MTSFGRDVRLACRSLLVNPLYATAAVGILALGIGITTAAFSLVNGFLLRPLPGAKNNAQLRVVALSRPGDPGWHGVSYLDYLDYHEATNAFDDVSAYMLGAAVLTANGQSDRVILNYVTSDFFLTLGSQPAVGRLFVRGEGDQPGSGAVLILGYSLWQHRFGSDPNVVGRPVTIKGHPFTVIGVAPPALIGPYTPIETGAYVPLGSAGIVSTQTDLFLKRDRDDLKMLVRPRPGVGSDHALAALQTVADRLAREFPRTDAGVRVGLFPERLARPDPQDSTGVSLVAMVFLGLASLVLMVTCVDVTNLALVRATSRQQEMAVRASLGAARWRLIRESLIDSLLISGFGGIAGAGVGVLLSRLVALIRMPNGLPIRVDLSFDWRVFAWITAVSTLSGLMVGLMPAVRAVRLDVYAALNERTGARTQSRRGRRFRAGLVIVQVAAAYVVLAAAGLFVHSLSSAEHLDLGFQPSGVLNLAMDASQPGYDEFHAESLFTIIQDRVRTIPGVTNTTYASTVPVSFYLQEEMVRRADQASIPDDQAPMMLYNVVDPDYFSTMRIPIVRGRAFRASDRPGSPPVAIVNETLAAMLWSGQDPIGQRLIVGRPSAPVVEVVGVARNGRYGSLTEEPQPSFFLPIAQHYTASRVLQVRSDLSPSVLARTIERQISDLDPNLPVFDVMTMDESLGGHNGFFLLRVGARLASGLGVFALLLAVVGVYSVIASVASQSTRDIGVRMALGAQARDVARQLAGRVMALVILGVVIGAAVALGTSRLLVRLLYRVGADDPAAFVTVAALLVAVSALACYLPARRAAHLNPVIALRRE